MNKTIKPLSIAIGAAFIGSLALAGSAVASNGFGMTDLDSGYQLVGEKGKEGKCGEGKCGEDKKAEGACGEGKKAEGACGEGKKAEGKCGEGKCGGAA